MVVRRRRGTYVAYVPELSLSATAGTAADALSALQAKQALLQPELSRFGSQLGLFMLSGPALPILSRALLFVLKAFIVVFLAFVIAAYAQHVVEERLDGLRKLGGPAFWSGLESDLMRVADARSDVPQATKEEVLANLRVGLQRWRPLVREAQRVFSDTPERQPLQP